MYTALRLGNKYAEYAMAHNISDEGAGLWCSVAHLPLDPEKFEAFGSPSIVVVYPSRESSICLNFFRDKIGVTETGENVAYMTLPFGETTSGKPELGGYIIDKKNGQAVGLTATQRLVALKALRSALEYPMAS